MKTVCVLGINPFLTDSRLERHVDALIESGYQVVVICHRGNSDAPLEERRSNLIVRRFEKYRKHPSKFKAVRRWDVLYRTNVVYGGPNTRSFMSIAGEYKFDLVYANDVPTLEAAYRIARRKNIPIVFDARDMYLHQFRRYIENRKVSWGWRRKLLHEYLYRRRALVERLLLPKVDLFITVNPLIEEHYRRRYGLNRTTSILNVPPRSLLDNPGIGLRKKLGIDSDDRVVAYHGGLAKTRGVMELAGAAAQLPDDIHVVLVGYGDAWNELEAFVESYPRNNLHLMSAIPYENLVSSLREVDLSIVPIHGESLSHYLAAPNKLFESLLAGTPLLVPDYPYMSAIVHETKMGAVFDGPIHADTLAAAIKRFFDRHSTEVPENFVSPYVWETERKKFLAVMAEVLSPPLTKHSKPIGSS